jgi:hypothetical protein
MSFNSIGTNGVEIEKGTNIAGIKKNYEVLRISVWS